MFVFGVERSPYPSIRSRSQRNHSINLISLYDANLELHSKINFLKARKEWLSYLPTMYLHPIYSNKMEINEKKNQFVLLKLIFQKLNKSHSLYCQVPKQIQFL